MRLFTGRGGVTAVLPGLPPGALDAVQNGWPSRFCKCGAGQAGGGACWQCGK